MTEAIEIAQIYLGNINLDADLASTLLANSYLELSLSASEQPKGRIHGYTTSGIAVGLIKKRSRSLQSGDLYQTDSGKLLLINLEAEELLVIDLLTVNSVSPAQLIRLGHVLGNHHYPIHVESDRILVQLITDKAIVEKLIKDLNIPEIKIGYQKREGDRDLLFSQHSH